MHTRERLRRLRASGMTLIELLIVSVLGGMIVITMASAVVVFGRLMQFLEDSFVLHQEARQALMRIERDLKRSTNDRITVEAEGLRLQFALPRDDDGANGILDAVDPSLIDWNPQSYVYELAAGETTELWRRGGGEPDQRLARHVQRILFEKGAPAPTTEPGEIRVVLTMTDAPATIEAQSLIQPRN
jgi:hypothetical protein